MDECKPLPQAGLALPLGLPRQADLLHHVQLLLLLCCVALGGVSGAGGTRAALGAGRAVLSGGARVCRVGVSGKVTGRDEEGNTWGGRRG